jgi:hypothetical protein
MKSMKAKIARRAVKSTARHTAHGTTSKLRRDPLRAGSLLAIGGAVGLAAGWALARPGSISSAT